MLSRRLEMIGRTIRDSVSDAIQNRLSDPRIQGMISVTRVETAGDLRSARVYLSVLGVDEKQQELSLRGISHASGRIQRYLAKKLTIRTCPTLSFHLDDSLKKGYQITKLIDQAAAEYAEAQEVAPTDRDVAPESDNEG